MQDTVREQRRLIVEDFIAAHYENGCDGAAELAWWEAHPEALARLTRLTLTPGVAGTPSLDAAALVRELDALTPLQMPLQQGGTAAVGWALPDWLMHRLRVALSESSPKAG